MDATHTPAPIRFMVWDGQTMHEVEPGDWLRLHALTTRETSTFPQYESIREPRPDAVVLLSTGLRDADGREVFDGHIVEWTPKLMPTRALVTHQPGETGWWLTSPNRDALPGDDRPVPTWDLLNERLSPRIRIVGHALTDPHLLPARPAA